MSGCGAAHVAPSADADTRGCGAEGELRGIVRPAWPDLGNKADLMAAASALAAGGVAGLAFYNWGHLRKANVGWIADALNAFGGKP